MAGLYCCSYQSLVKILCFLWCDHSTRTSGISDCFRWQKILTKLCNGDLRIFPLSSMIVLVFTDFPTDSEWAFALCSAGKLWLDKVINHFIFNSKHINKCKFALKLTQLWITMYLQFIFTRSCTYIDNFLLFTLALYFYWIKIKCNYVRGNCSWTLVIKTKIIHVFRENLVVVKIFSLPKNLSEIHEHRAR